MSAECITPAVVVDGRTVPLEGWMIVMAFALAGVPWAVRDATNPEFQLREKILDYNRRRGRYYTEQTIEYYERRLVELRGAQL